GPPGAGGAYEPRSGPLGLADELAGGVLGGQHVRDLEELAVDVLLVRDDLVQVAEHDAAPVGPDHHAAHAPHQGPHRVEPEARGQHAVAGRRRPAALGVAEDHRANLVARDLLDGPLEVPGAAGVGALGDDDYRRGLAALLGRCDQLRDLVRRHRLLGDQDRLGAAGDAHVQRDVAGVPAHDLDEEEPVVAGGGVAQAVDGFERDVDRGVEADRDVGAEDVVVDGAGDADDGHAVLLRQGQRPAEAAVAADHDQALDAAAPQHGGGLRPARRVEELLGARRAEDRAAALDDVRDVPGVQLDDVVLDEALVPAVDARDAGAVVDRRADDGADGGVHAGRVAPAGEYGDVLHGRPV